MLLCFFWDFKIASWYYCRCAPARSLASETATDRSTRHTPYVVRSLTRKHHGLSLTSPDQPPPNVRSTGPRQILQKSAWKEALSPSEREAPSSTRAPVVLLQIVSPCVLSATPLIYLRGRRLYYPLARRLRQLPAFCVCAAGFGFGGSTFGAAPSRTCAQRRRDTKRG